VLAVERVDHLCAESESRRRWRRTASPGPVGRTPRCDAARAGSARGGPTPRPVDRPRSGRTRFASGARREGPERKAGGCVTTISDEELVEPRGSGAGQTSMQAEQPVHRSSSIRGFPWSTVMAPGVGQCSTQTEQNPPVCARHFHARITATKLSAGAAAGRRNSSERRETRPDCAHRGSFSVVPHDSAVWSAFGRSSICHDVAWHCRQFCRHACVERSPRAPPAPWHARQSARIHVECGDGRGRTGPSARAAARRCETDERVARRRGWCRARWSPPRRDIGGSSRSALLVVGLLRTDRAPRASRG
jgi:hypothetical protein